MNDYQSKNGKTFNENHFRRRNRPVNSGSSGNVFAVDNCFFGRCEKLDFTTGSSLQLFFDLTRGLHSSSGDFCGEARRRFRDKAFGRDGLFSAAAFPVALDGDLEGDLTDNLWGDFENDFTGDLEGDLLTELEGDLGDAFNGDLEGDLVEEGVVTTLVTPLHGEFPKEVPLALLRCIGDLGETEGTDCTERDFLGVVFRLLTADREGISLLCSFFLGEPSAIFGVSYLGEFSLD
ncbi:Autophagy-related protein 2 [Frankliniella fusca]|uniref:Autophagy-related protein 2 n=1 Tax=Frankliniella fusca TaxID=407009 RepID=A0AAE1I379_9NEOP|nr:Autophagy-related protein 2 [Frankliniella fusca]